MDFFAAQARARRTSRWLVVAFLLAVVAVAVAMTLLVILLLLPLGAFPGLLADPVAALVARWPLLATVAGVVGGTILVASIRKTLELREGARVIARDLGAGRLVPATAAGDERRLLNVVEELAIAATLPVPAIYLLPGPGLNALVAGYGYRRAALFVTRPCLEVLSRDELQGVIAHEFSHIVNGDMRLNTRLVGLLHGLFVISEIGRSLLPPPDDERPQRAQFWSVAGLLAFAIGLVGLVAGRALQAAVARERERLADATAVQFARESRGLRNALVRIGAHRYGSTLTLPAIDRFWHMLFAPPGALDFATHPPLHERIRALDPSFDPAEIGRLVRALAPGEAAERAERLGLAALPVASDGRVALRPDAVPALIGTAGPADLALAVRLRAALPAEFLAAAGEPEGALALALALAMPDDAAEAGSAMVAERFGTGLAARASRLLPMVADLPAIERLPAALLLGESLRELPVPRLQELLRTLNAWTLRSGRPTVFAYALRQFVRMLIEAALPPERGRRPPLSLLAVRPDLELLLGVLARLGSPDDSLAARQALTAGWQRLGFVVPAGLPALVAWARPLDAALRRLDRLALADKQRVIAAMAATVVRDGTVTVSEAELLRLLCAVLRCPLPSLVVTDWQPTAVR